MGTLVKDAGLLDRDEYPICVQVDDLEGVILEELGENCYPSISDAEDFVKTYYGNVPGVTAYVYELKGVYKVVEDSTENKDSLEDLKQQIKSLIAQADSAIAKIDTALKERR